MSEGVTLMTYLQWYDDRKLSAAQKITAGAAAYQARFGRAPTLVQVNEMDITDVPGIRVQSEAYVRPNNFRFGLIVEESER